MGTAYISACNSATFRSSGFRFGIKMYTFCGGESVVRPIVHKAHFINSRDNSKHVLEKFVRRARDGAGIQRTRVTYRVEQQQNRPIVDFERCEDRIVAPEVRHKWSRHAISTPRLLGHGVAPFAEAHDAMLRRFDEHRTHVAALAKALFLANEAPLAIVRKIGGFPKPQWSKLYVAEEMDVHRRDSARAMMSGIAIAS